MNVTTPAGRVEGVDAAGATAFLGIPYAEAPLGALRWQAPQPARPWSGVRAATALPPGPPQPGVGPVGGASLPGIDVERTDEDCLTVNVWVPRGASSAPVMVWLPGGAFVTGGAGIPLYDGAALASRQGVVVVTVTYRVGAIGFAALPDAPANRGLLDQAAALEWVRESIDGFGGDPANVTLFGESAGGGSILHLCSMPATVGLFRRAIVQSGATDYTLDPAQADAVAQRFLGALGADAASIDKVDVGRIVDAQGEAMFAMMAEVGAMPFHPVVDGAVVTRRPVDALADASTGDVALLIGTTRDEMRMFLDPGAAGLDRDGLIGRAAYYLASHDVADAADAAVSLAGLYDGDPHLPAPGDAWSAMQTDGEMRRPAAAMADAHANSGAATFVYRFDEPLAGRLSHVWSCHGADIPYPFGAVDRCGWAEVVGPGAPGVSNAVQAAWAGFARDGEPSCDELGAWPAYETGRRPTMLLAGQPGVADDPEGERRERWAEIAPVRHS